MADNQPQFGPDSGTPPNAAEKACVTPASFLVRHSVWAALLISAALVTVHIGIDWLLFRAGDSRIAFAAESGVIIGGVTFVLLLQILRYSRVRRERILERLEMIDEMNHHIRNALQVIAFNARPSSANDWELAEIKRAVSRINWTLREVLPKMEPEFEIFEGSAREHERIKALNQTSEQQQQR